MLSLLPQSPHGSNAHADNTGLMRVLLGDFAAIYLADLMRRRLLIGLSVDTVFNICQEVLLGALYSLTVASRASCIFFRSL